MVRRLKERFTRPVTPGSNPSPPAGRFDAAIKGMARGTALVFIVMYFFTALPRLGYPYDLDFIEDGLLLTSLRVADGQSVFIPPSADFTPHVYMPLFTWLGGLVFAVTGPGLPPLRWLSLAALMTSTGLIFWITRRESGQSWLGLVAAGLLLGGYRLSGFGYELARVDSLFVALTLGGLTIATYAASKKAGLIAAGVVLALAFFTKQTGLIFGVGVFGYLLGTIGRRAWWFGATFGLLAIIPAAGLNWLSDGWFWYYTVHIAGINPLEWGRVLHYVGPELLGQMGGLTMLALMTAGLAVRRVGRRIIAMPPWLGWLGLAVLVSGLGRASVGGNVNNLMPGYTLLCLAPALLWREWRARPHRWGRWGIGLICGLVLLQFALGAYNPGRYQPTPAMRRSGDRLIAALAETEGEVLVMMHPWYAGLAGKRPSAQVAALWHARERGSLPLPEELVARLKGHYYVLIVSDNSLFETEPGLQALLDTYYQPASGPVAGPPTMSGMIAQPMVMYVPRPAAP
jgi:4-amino-4-deoxy-L-arabinose transferase-like glycosyltransferase